MVRGRSIAVTSILVARFANVAMACLTLPRLVIPAAPAAPAERAAMKGSPSHRAEIIRSRGRVVRQNPAGEPRQQALPHQVSLAKTPSASEVVDLSVRSAHHLSSMITPVLHLLRLLPVLFGGHRQLALENLALRQQLAVYKRLMTRPRLRRTDRLFWVGLARIWAGWR